MVQEEEEKKIHQIYPNIKGVLLFLFDSERDRSVFCKLLQTKKREKKYIYSSKCYW